MSIFSSVLHCPLQLDSVELFMKCGHLFSVSGTYTQSKHLVNQIATCFLALYLCFCSSTDLLVADFFPFLVKSSHMAPSLDTMTNIFHDYASMNFHLPVCLYYSERVFPPR